MFRFFCIALLLPSSVLACGPSDITLDKLRGQVKYDNLLVYGVIKHDCPEAVGVQLKLTVYNSNGEIVDVHKSWPASIKNIPPGTPYTFKIFADSGGSKGKFTVDVDAVKVWTTR